MLDLFGLRFEHAPRVERNGFNLLRFALYNLKGFDNRLHYPVDLVYGQRQTIPLSWIRDLMTLRVNKTLEIRKLLNLPNDEVV